MKLKLIKKDGVKHITIVEEPKQYIELDVTYLWNEDLINVDDEGLVFELKQLLRPEEKEALDYGYPDIAYLGAEELRELCNYWPFDESTGELQEVVPWFICDNQIRLNLEYENIVDVYSAWKDHMMSENEMEYVANDFQEDIMEVLEEFREEIINTNHANWDDYEDICSWVDREILKIGTELQRRMTQMSNKW